mgnify:CR=1 FL=1
MIMISNVGSISSLCTHDIVQFNNLDYPAKPRWQLDESAIFLKRAGVKL